MELKDLPTYVQKHLDFAKNFIEPTESAFIHMIVSYSDGKTDMFAIENKDLFDSVIHRVMLDEKKIGLVEDVVVISEGWRQTFTKAPDDPDHVSSASEELARRQELYGEKWSNWPDEAKEKYLEDTLQIDASSGEKSFHVSIPLKRDGKTVNLFEDKAMVGTNLSKSRIGRGLYLIFKSREIYKSIYKRENP